MAFSIGIILAVAVGGLARWIGLDRERAFYPTVMAVIASYYVLFAAMTASPAVLLAEIALSVVFIVLAMAGFKKSLWFVVIALVTHGVFDLFYPHAIHQSGAPAWWPDFCLAYDVAAAAFLAWRLTGAKSAHTWKQTLPSDPRTTLGQEPL